MTGGRASTATAVIVELRRQRRDRVDRRRPGARRRRPRAAYTDGLGPSEPASQLDDRGGIRSTSTSRPRAPASTRSATSSPARCSRTRPRKRASPASSTSPGRPGHVNYDAIPGVVYTHPEIARVGKTEERAEGGRHPVPRRAVPASRPTAAPRPWTATDGSVKILAHEETDRILGVHIVGASAAELIAEAAVAMEFGAAPRTSPAPCTPTRPWPRSSKRPRSAAGGRVIHI